MTIKKIKVRYRRENYKGDGMPTMTISNGEACKYMHYWVTTSHIPGYLVKHPDFLFDSLLAGPELNYRNLFETWFVVDNFDRFHPTNIPCQFNK